MTKKYAIYETISDQKGGKKRKKVKNIRPLLQRYKIPNDADSQFISKHAQMCPKYPYTPSILPACARVIVMGDIHGDYELAINYFKLGNLIRIENNIIKWVGHDTIVVQVGDQIDRCRPIGNMTCEHEHTTYNDEASDIKILNLFTNLDIQARKHGGMVISLFGNHELMNSMGQLNYVSREGIKEFEHYKDINNPNIYFGSAIEARIHAFAPGNEYGKFMGCTRLPAVIIGSNLFVHAGIIDHLVQYLNINKKEDIESINISIKKWLLGVLDRSTVDELVSSSKHSMFWTRILGSIPPNVDYDDPMCASNIGEVLKIFKINNIIVGHTPQSFMYSDGINSTCSNKIFRVDNAGSAAFHKFDHEFMNTGKVTDSRTPQVLEIINDSTYNILK